MKAVNTILRKELRSFFVSPLAYIGLTSFVLLAAYFFFNLLATFNMAVAKYAALPVDLGVAAPGVHEWVIEPYYRSLTVLLAFVLPVLSMRSIAEERRQGTFELLATSPVTAATLLWGKFLGLCAIVLVLVGMSFSFVGLLFFLGEPEWPTALSGLGALLLCGFAFASICLAASAIAPAPTSAGIMGAISLLLLLIIHSPAESLGGGEEFRSIASRVFLALSPAVQMREMLQGVLSLRVGVYFVSLMSFGLLLAYHALRFEGWRDA